MKNDLKFWVLTFSVLTLGACEGYHMPSMNNSNVAGMSDQTLCYRYATATARSEALAGEINSRHINCSRILADDPLIQQQQQH